MREMSRSEALAFLAEGTRTGKLAVTRRDGRPLVTPVWFTVEDETLVFMTGTDTLKARAMRREPRISLSVDLEAPPYAYVRVDGTAEVIEDEAALLGWATRIAERYMGREWAAARAARNAVPEERIVRVTPTRIVAWADVAG